MSDCGFKCLLIHRLPSCNICLMPPSQLCIMCIILQIKIWQLNCIFFLNKKENKTYYKITPKVLFTTCCIVDKLISQSPIGMKGLLELATVLVSLSLKYDSFTLCHSTQRQCGICCSA